MCNLNDKLARDWFNIRRFRSTCLTINMVKMEKAQVREKNTGANDKKNQSLLSGFTVDGINANECNMYKKQNRLIHSHINVANTATTYLLYLMCNEYIICILPKEIIYKSLLFGSKILSMDHLMPFIRLLSFQLHITLLAISFQHPITQIWQSTKYLSMSQ